MKITNLEEHVVRGGTLFGKIDAFSHICDRFECDKTGGHGEIYEF